jgi:hypothetical protein
MGGGPCAFAAGNGGSLVFFFFVLFIQGRPRSVVLGMTLLILLPILLGQEGGQGCHCRWVLSLYGLQWIRFPTIPISRSNVVQPSGPHKHLGIAFSLCTATSVVGCCDVGRSNYCTHVRRSPVTHEPLQRDSTRIWPWPRFSTAPTPESLEPSTH